MDALSDQNQSSLISAKNFDVHIEAFLQSLDVRLSSKNTYGRQLREFFAWIYQEHIQNVNREHILKYKEYLANQKGLAAYTVSGYLTAVRRFFEWLESIKAYPNVAKSIRGPKRRHGFRRDALSLESVKSLLAHIDRSTLEGKRDYAMINLMVRTGLRTIEVVRARQEDLSRQSGIQILWIQGKGRDSKDEFVVCTEKTMVPIHDYMVMRGVSKQGEPLFTSLSTKNWGQALTTRSVSRIVKNRLKEIGLNDRRLSAHSLRHTAITLSLLAGATAQEARIMARHADINTTLIYAHNINRVSQAPEQKIDTLLD